MGIFCAIFSEFIVFVGWDAWNVVVANKMAVDKAYGFIAANGVFCALLSLSAAGSSTGSMITVSYGRKF